jgi:SNF family Na+-dependent transporter
VFAYLKSITCCISERFFTKENRTAVFLSIVSGFFGIFMLGQKGKGFISLLDGKITPFIILTVGVLELYVFMQLSKTNSLLKEINQNAKKGFPKGFYNLSVCVFSPVLIILLILAEILF